MIISLLFAGLQSTFFHVRISKSFPCFWWEIFLSQDWRSNSENAKSAFCKILGCSVHEEKKEKEKNSAMITERKRGQILICFQFVFWHKQIAQSNKMFGVLSPLGWRAAKNVPQVCVFWWRIEDLVPSVCCGQGKGKERGCYGNVNTWVAAQTGLPRVCAAVIEVRGAKRALLMAPSFL